MVTVEVDCLMSGLLEMACEVSLENDELTTPMNQETHAKKIHRLPIMYTPSGPKYLQQIFSFFLCDPRRTRRFCTRVGLAISEYHPIDEYKLQIA